MYFLKGIGKYLVRFDSVVIVTSEFFFPSQNRAGYMTEKKMKPPLYDILKAVLWSAGVPLYRANTLQIPFTVL